MVTIFAMAVRYAQLRRHISNESDSTSPTWNVRDEDANSYHQSLVIFHQHKAIVCA